MEHLVDEIEGMGRSQRAELTNRLGVLLAHLLKWQAQPAYRSRSWRLTIDEQRRRLGRHLEQNPSLRGFVDAAVVDAYGDAVIIAQRETGLDETAFPPRCVWPDPDVFRADFFPD